MRVRTTTALLTIAMLLSAGCSAPQVEPGVLGQMTEGSGSMRPSALRQELFLGVFSLGSVLVYNPANFKKIRTINNLPEDEGIAVESQGTLYVADYANKEVEVFKGGATKPSQLIPACKNATGYDGPIDVAVTSNLGLLVTCQLGETLVFAPGARKPKETLTFHGLGFGLGVTLDQNKNVYVVGATHGSCQCPVIVEYVGGKEPGKNLSLLELTAPIKLLVDNKGNFVISDVAGYVFLYHHGAHVPYRSISIYQAYRIAFNKAETLLYVTLDYPGSVNIYEYPSLKPVKQFKVPGAWGVAIWPPAN